MSADNQALLSGAIRFLQQLLNQSTRHWDTDIFSKACNAVSKPVLPVHVPLFLVGGA